MALNQNLQTTAWRRLFFKHSTLLLSCLLGQQLWHAAASPNWYLQEIELRELVTNSSLHSVTKVSKVRVSLDDGAGADYEVKTLLSQPGEITLKLRENKTVVTHQGGSCLFQSNLCVACDYDVCSTEEIATVANPKRLSTKSNRDASRIVHGGSHSVLPQESTSLIRSCCGKVKRNGSVTALTGSDQQEVEQRREDDEQHSHQLRPKSRHLVPSRFGSSGGRSRDIFFNTGRLYDRGVTDVMAGRFSALAVTGRCVGTRLQCREP